MTKKLFRQVHGSTGRFFFRLTLPVARFQCEERYDSPEDAALRCDLFKAYLVSTFRLTGNTMFPSLPPEHFSARLAEAGIDSASPQSLFDALPQSCRDFLMDGGHDELTKYRDNLPAMNKVVLAGDANDLRILLPKVLKPLRLLLSDISKAKSVARQEHLPALDALEEKMIALEQYTRTEVDHILSIP